MSKEYIEREALINLIEENSETKFDWSECVDIDILRPAIRDFPAADVVPVRYAYWDYQNDGTHFCSDCGCDAPCNRNYREVCSTWCPTCGAFMTEVRNNG